MKALFLRNKLARAESTREGLVKLFLILVVILIIHTIAMVYLEGMAISDAIWLTMTSATTVGYGDLSAQTTGGRIATVILLYLGGIAILAQVAAMYFGYRHEVRRRMLRGDWSWNMENHIVILNCTERFEEEFFHVVMKQLRKSSLELSSAPIIIAGDAFKDGISSSLRKLNVATVQKSVHSDKTFEDASVCEASTVVILATDPNDPASDSVTFDTIHRLRDTGVQANIICEVVKLDNKERLLNAGANNVVRPVCTYPEMLVRTILSPGSEQLIDDLYDSFGEECIRYNLNVKDKWANIVIKLVQNDIGTPIAYLDDDNRVIINAKPDDEINATALFTIVREGNLKSLDNLSDILNQSQPVTNN